MKTKVTGFPFDVLFLNGQLLQQTLARWGRVTEKSSRKISNTPKIYSTLKIRDTTRGTPHLYVSQARTT
jgi:hypothetical protein